MGYILTTTNTGAHGDTWHLYREYLGMYRSLRIRVIMENQKKLNGTWNGNRGYVGSALGL